ncbi:hypothetical protein AU375_04347 [Methylobacterium radiotolerans]|nr:hypothetical protein AU375_04347 [Methylobacterium radiotolerans]
MRLSPLAPSILLATLALLAGPAHAEENECRRPPSLASGPPPIFGRITAPGRTAFVKDGLARAGCPDPSAACRERAYLVTADPVILGERRGAYVCAHYRGAGDDMGRSGWLPAEAVAVEPSSTVAPADWLGTWTRPEARVRVTPGDKPVDKPGMLTFAGDATWGAGDPERVRRGGVHIGEFAGTVAPQGDAASFAVGESGALPVETGDASDCKVWLRRVGPWLIVDDNLACGGLNVSFRGLYRRQP